MNQSEEFIQDLGHEDPAILLTNQSRVSVKRLITRYAQRMLIENALSDAVRFFHMDALSSAVGLKVDFDMALKVIASGLYRLLAQRMRGYSNAQARQIFRDIVDMPADVKITAKEVLVSFHRRAYLLIILASNLINNPVKVPWWNDLPLRLTTYQGLEESASRLGQLCAVEIQARETLNSQRSDYAHGPNHSFTWAKHVRH